MNKPIIYQISIQEHLGEQWAEWFAPLVIHHQPNGQTVLVGPLRDQAELHGILLKVSNLNLTLVAVTQATPPTPAAPVSEQLDEKDAIPPHPAGTVEFISSPKT